ncbi:MAG: ISL3 family transposase [Actinobacteria bacterium]|nr:ISL3 family transposase [Actinomycetota bacterium]MCA1698538.1 ISL3 family transposase [Actinomycetota bacterium]
MRPTRVWKKLLGLSRVVVEAVEFEEAEGALVVSVRPKAREQGRCPHCRRRCPGYDWGEGRRRWRSLDLGTTLCFLEAEAPRVECRRHGVVVAAVPWARHDSNFTRAFEDQVCWLAVNTSKTAVSELMRIAWRTVGWICQRAMAEQSAMRDLFAGIRRIGIDDFSHRRGHRYLTVVVDHDSGRLIWAAPGRDKATVEKFLDLLGTERCEQLELVSCDMAESIAAAIAERCPNAVRCVDPFHVIALATDALDEIRREVWNQARRAGHKQAASELKGSRFVLWKNPHRLTERQQIKLAEIQHTNKPLYRAYLISQQLREIYRVPYQEAIELLDAWLAWARRCRLKPFVKLAKTITRQRAGIEAAIRHGLSNARVEQVNTQIRLITRRGYGFHSPHAVIALAMLSLGGLCPALPGR